MGKIEKYKKILREELEYQSSISYANAPNLKSHLIINEEGTELILVKLGWFHKEFRYGVVYHFELRDNKVWLYQNTTDVDIGVKLEKRGIPKSDVVLAFISKLERTAEGYALA